MKILKIMLLLLIYFIVLNAILISQEFDITSKNLIHEIDVELDSLSNSIYLEAKEHILRFHNFYEIDKFLLNGDTKVAIGHTNYGKKWKDPDVKKGDVYIYQVGSICTGYANYEDFSEDSYKVFKPNGNIVSGINIEGYVKKRTVLILVDSTVYKPLKPEIERLRNDLITEGWGVRIDQIQRSEVYEDGSDMEDTGRLISRLYKYQKNINLETVIFLGRIAQFYSGNFAPDGHKNHEGAWPADGLYGVMNDDLFFDTVFVENTNSDWERNHQSKSSTKHRLKLSYNKFPYNVDLQIGRIDMYNLPSFEESEIELLRRYLDKNHKYRTAQMDIERRALIDDNMPAYDYVNAPASSAWRNFVPLFGKDNIDENKFFPTLENETYLASFACGPGHPFDSLEEVGSTRDFATKQVNSVFTMFYGDYIGDWDSEDNFLRAALASEPSVLTSCWSGSPHWFLQHMGIGYPIGFSTRLTQNNKNLVPFSFKTFSDDPNEEPVIVPYDPYKRGVHVALLGDPTLTMYPLPEEKTAKNLEVEKLDDNKVRLTWDLPEGNELHYYDVFRGTHEYGPFEKVNENHIIVGTYEDEFNYKGQVWYMVRKKVIERSPTATFWKHLRGNMVDVELTANSVEYTYNYSNFTAEPNPANEQIRFEFHLPNPAFTKLEIYNQQGQLIKTKVSKHLNKGSNTFSWSLTNETDTKVLSGIYIAKLTAGDKAEVRKVVVVR